MMILCSKKRKEKLKIVCLDHIIHINSCPFLFNVLSYEFIAENIAPIIIYCLEWAIKLYCPNHCKSIESTAPAKPH